MANIVSPYSAASAVIVEGSRPVNLAVSDTANTAASDDPTSTASAASAARSARSAASPLLVRRVSDSVRPAGSACSIACRNPASTTPML